MQNWEDPIADSHVTTSATAPAVFIDTAAAKEVPVLVDPQTQQQAQPNPTFDEVVSNSSTSSVIEATAALQKLRDEVVRFWHC